MKKKMAITLAAASMAVLSAALLTGCGKSGSSPEGGNKEDNKLNVYNWGEYIDEDVITQFEEETGIQVVYDVFETNEEMYPVIEAGAVKYDVVCPSDYMIQRMIENDLLAELNFDNIPNYKEIGQQYLDISKGFDPENKYSVPYCWGTMGILYNTKRLEELGVPAPTKWSDLWDERLSGEILMQNSVRDAFTVALKMKGYSLNSTNPDELAEARDLLIEQKPLVQAYVIDQVRDKMIGGEAAVGVIYSGEMLYIQDAVAEQGLEPTTGSTPGSFPPTQSTRKTQKNGLTSCAALILQKRTLNISPTQRQTQAPMIYLTTTSKITRPCSLIWISCQTARLSNIWETMWIPSTMICGRKLNPNKNQSQD